MTPAHWFFLVIALAVAARLVWVAAGLQAEREQRRKSLENLRRIEEQQRRRS